MTITKKLLTAGVLLLGMQNATQTYYDAAVLKTEVTKILDFAQNLHQQMSPEAQKAAEYLNKIVADNNNENYYLVTTTNDDIIALARIINSDVTADAKMASILNIKAEKATKHVQYVKNRVIEACALAAVCTLYGSIVAYAIYEKFMLAVQRHDNNLSYKIQEECQKMINTTIDTKTNTNTSKKWYERN